MGFPSISATRIGDVDSNCLKLLKAFWALSVHSKESVERQGLLIELLDKPTECSHPPSQPLDSVQVLWFAHLEDTVILVWVRLNSPLKNDETK